MDEESLNTLLGIDLLAMRGQNLIAFLGDTHFGARGDNDTIMNMQMKYFDEIFFPTLVKLGVKYVVQLGDMFDKRKGTNHLTLHKTRIHFLERFAKEGIKLIAFDGNHNIFYRDTNDISSCNELIRGYGDSIIVVRDNATLNFGSFKMDIIPWINTNNHAQTMAFINNSTSDICCGHFEFTGFKFDSSGRVAEKGIGITPFKKYKHVYSGHFHTRSTQGNITYTGTPYELTASDYNDTKGFMIMNMDTFENTYVDNPQTLHNKFVYNDSVDDYKNIDVDHFKKINGMFCEIHVNHKSKKKMFEKYMSLVYRNAPAKVDIIDNTQRVTYKEDVSVTVTDTKELLSDSIDGMTVGTSTAIDKSYLRELSDEIYLEAMAVGR